MDFKQAEKRAQELTKLIRYHNERYYNEDAPEITDYEYDMLLRKLKSISYFRYLRFSDSSSTCIC